jgi:hypothetical protein
MGQWSRKSRIKFEDIEPHPDGVLNGAMPILAPRDPGATEPVLQPWILACIGGHFG